MFIYFNYFCIMEAKVKVRFRPTVKMFRALEDEVAMLRSENASLLDELQASRMELMRLRGLGLWDRIFHFD